MYGKVKRPIRYRKYSTWATECKRRGQKENGRKRADWAQLQEALFPRHTYNLHMAFCDGLHNRKGLISPASHHGIHPAVCSVYVTKEKTDFLYGFWIWILDTKN